MNTYLNIYNVYEYIYICALETSCATGWRKRQVNGGGGGLTRVYIYIYIYIYTCNLSSGNPRFVLPARERAKKRRMQGRCDLSSTLYICYI